jgi:hypothetical protein
VERGRLADDVLNNQVYAESYDQIEKEIHAKWQNSRDKDDREHLHRLLMALLLVRSTLEATMRSGKLAADKLDRERKLSERIGFRSRNS